MVSRSVSAGGADVPEPLDVEPVAATVTIATSTRTTRTGPATRLTREDRTSHRGAMRQRVQAWALSWR